MSQVYNLLGTGMLVVGSLGGVINLGKSCLYVADYNPILIAEMDCNKRFLDENRCIQIHKDKNNQHKKIISGSAIGLGLLAVAYAGYKIREKGSPLQ